MTTKYQVTITKIEEGEGFSSTYERIADTGNELDGGPVYAYVKKPVINIDKNVVFKQTLEDLDVTAVIRATNKIFPVSL